MLNKMTSLDVLFLGEEFAQAYEYTASFASAHALQCKYCSRSEANDSIARTSVAIPLMTKIDARMIENARGLRLVLQFGVGLEGVDVNSATKKGIKVGRIKSDSNPNSKSTAECAVFLALCALKRVNECKVSIERMVLGYPIGESLTNANVMFIGWGRVARACAKMCKFGFGCRIYALRRSNNGSEDRGNSSDEELNLLENERAFVGSIDECEIEFSKFRTNNNVSTIVVLACTCDSTNKEMVNKGFIEKLKFGDEQKRAIVVNVARGQLVNEEDMFNACKNRDVLFYASDVAFSEPIDPSGTLLREKLDNVFVTPHVGGVTRSSYEKMGQIVADYVAKIKKDDYAIIESDEFVSIVN